MRPAALSSFVVALVALVALAGCDGPRAAPPPVTPTEPVAHVTPAAPAKKEPIPIVAMRLVPSDPSRGGGLEIREDGSIHARGRMVARIEGSHVVEPNESAIIDVMADGAILVRGSDRRASFTANDELTTSDGARIVIDDTGQPILTSRTGKTEPFPGKFEGFTPRGRRAALLVMVLILTRERRLPPPPPPGGSAPPPTRLPPVDPTS